MSPKALLLVAIVALGLVVVVEARTKYVLNFDVWNWDQIPSSVMKHQFAVVKYDIEQPWDAEHINFNSFAWSAAREERYVGIPPPKEKKVVPGKINEYLTNTYDDSHPTVIIGEVRTKKDSRSPNVDWAARYGIGEYDTPTIVLFTTERDEHGTSRWTKMPIAIFEHPSEKAGKYTRETLARWAQTNVNKVLKERGSPARWKLAMNGTWEMAHETLQCRITSFVDAMNRADVNAASEQAALLQTEVLDRVDMLISNEGKKDKVFSTEAIERGAKMYRVRGTDAVTFAHKLMKEALDLVSKGEKKAAEAVASVVATEEERVTKVFHKAAKLKPEKSHALERKLNVLTMFDMPC